MYMMISLFYDINGMIDLGFNGPFEKYFSHVEQLHLIYNLWDFYNIRDTLNAPRKNAKNVC